MITGAESGSNTMQLIQMMREQQQQNLFQSTDTDGNGELSLSEFQVGAPDGASDSFLENAFSQADSDGNGSLTQEELNQSFQSLARASSQLSGSNLIQLQSSDLFDVIDSDSDGAVTLEEFKAGIPNGEADLASLFEQADSDGDGSLTQEELSSIFSDSAAASALPPPPQSASSGKSTSDSESYDVLDTNEDGIVSADEILASRGTDQTNKGRSLFELFDEDNGGSVTEEEQASDIERIQIEMQSHLISLQESAAIT